MKNTQKSGFSLAIHPGWGVVFCWKGGAYGIILLGLNIAIAIYASQIAKRKNRNPILWFFFQLFFWPSIIILLLFSGQKEDSNSRIKHRVW